MPKLLSHRVRWSWDSLLKGLQGLGRERRGRRVCRLRGKLGMLSGHLSQRNPLNAADKQYSALSKHFPREGCYYEETEVQRN